MAKKTVIRRLAKNLPLSSEADDTIRRDDALYDMGQQSAGNVRQLHAVETPRTIEGRLEAFAAEPSGDYSSEYSDDDFAAGAPAPAAEQPAEPSAAGTPAASGSSPVAGAAGASDKAKEAHQAGRDACDAGVDIGDVPGEYTRYGSWKKAWQDGYQQRGREIEEEMNQ